MGVQLKRAYLWGDYRRHFSLRHILFLVVFIIIILFFLQRTKIWAKYSKDIETYVDKRAHLGE